MNKKKKLIIILSVILLVLISASAIVIPYIANAAGENDGGTGSSGKGGGGSATKNPKGSIFDFVYVWYDDENFDPRTNPNTAPRQGWFTKGSSDISDTTWNFWIGALTNEINRMMVDGYGEDGWTANTNYMKSERWDKMREAMVEACQNAFNRDSLATHSRIVGIAVTWGSIKEYAEHQDNNSAYRQWYPVAMGEEDDTSFYKMFGKKGPTPDMLSTSSNNDWSKVVKKTDDNDANGTENWAEYIWRLGLADNPGDGDQFQVWVVAVTDNMPSPDNYFGYIKVHKTVPSGYSPVGATFGVYATKSDADNNRNALTTLTIKSGYDTETYKLDLGTSTSKTVYVKELSAPTSSGNYKWNIDTSVHSATVTSSNTSSSPYSFNITNTVQEYGYAYVEKTVPSGYNPSGAEYTIYTDYACTTEAGSSYFASGTKEKFTIKTDGTSNTIQFKVSTGNTLTLYVKETKTPTASGNYTWGWDTTVYTLKVSVSNTSSNKVKITSNEPVQEYGYAYIKKTVPSGYNPTGAEYTIYTDSNCTKIATSSIIADGSDPKFVIGEDGNSQKIKFNVPTGNKLTIYVKETKVPNQTGNFTWGVDEKIYKLEITKNNTSAAAVYDTSNEPVTEYGYAYVFKEVPANYQATGAEYTIYADNTCSKLLDDKYFYSGSNTKFIIGTDGKSNVIQFIVPTNGTLTFYVKETKLPNQVEDNFIWLKDERVQRITVSVDNTSSSPVRIESEDPVQEYGYAMVHKNVPTNYIPTGAEYTIYIDYACRIEADASYFVNGVEKFIIDSDGNSQKIKFNIPTNGTLTLYVKETKLPNQTGNFTWNYDENVYTITMSKNNDVNKPIIVTSNETVTEYGYAEIHKDVPNGYHPEGAEYTIYMNYDCTIPATSDIFASGLVEKFIIKTDGTSNKIQFIVPTNNRLVLYVKETKVPNQPQIGFDWLMDEQVYEIILTVNNTVNNPVHIASEDPVQEYGYVKIYKESDVDAQRDRVNGAEFTIYEGTGTKIAQEYNTDRGDVVLVIKNFETDTVCLKVGTYTIRETKVPAGFERMPDMTIEITKDCNKEFAGIKEINRENHLLKEYVYVTKLTDRFDKLDLYPLVGTKIGIYVDPECTTLAIDCVTLQPCILTVKEDMTTETICLELGTYYVREISTTQWYDLNTIAEKLILDEDGKTKTIDIMNYLKKGLGRVEKSYKDYSSNS